MTTVKSYIDTLFEIIEELSQFEDSEIVEAYEKLDGTVIYLVGEKQISQYKNNLN